MLLNWQKIALISIVVAATDGVCVDPSLFLKNNSDRLISVEPLTAGTSIAAEQIKPDGEYILKQAIGQINGLRIQYCPASYAGTQCNTDPAEFKQFAKTTEFNFKTPAKKCYVKLTINKDTLSLKSQEGKFGFTSGDHKYSLSGNIKNADIGQPKQIAATKPMPAQPQTTLQSAGKVGMTAPMMPLMEQAAQKDPHAFKLQLQELDEELKKIQQLTAKKDITRKALLDIENHFDAATKKYDKLEEEVTLARHQLKEDPFTQDEKALADIVSESFADAKNKISKLKEFLKISPASSSSQQRGEEETIKIGFNTVAELTLEERKKILQGIKTLAPELYELIIKEDPTGKDHILAEPHGRGMSMRPSWTTGLPVLAVEAEELNRPWGEVLFVLGHELAHYVFGDLIQEYHNDYPAEAIMKLTRQRLRENECDKMSVLEFGNKIDDGIVHHQYAIQKAREAELQQPHKKTFKADHSLSADRIKYLESLRRDVELKARNTQKTPIDWKKLVQEYKNAGATGTR